MSDKTDSGILLAEGAGDQPPIHHDQLINSQQLAQLRWFAIIGQLLAVLIVHFGLDYPLPIRACLAVIALSIGVGVMLHGLHVFWGRRSLTSFPRPSTYASFLSRRWMSNNAAFALLIFDAIQLALLLGLTGGLTNPFAILLLAPVTVSAMLLPKMKTIILVALVAVLASALFVFYLPLPSASASIAHEFMLPRDYMIGLWVALVVAAAFIAIYIGLLSRHAQNMTRALADARMTMAREEKMMSLGSLAAAAAHKLGSPLNTITLIGHELDALLTDSNRSDVALRQEINTLKTECERCRRILAELSEDATNDANMHPEPVSVLTLLQGLVEERFSDIGPMLKIKLGKKRRKSFPHITPRPDILYSLEMIIDNAVQFAHSCVEIWLNWDADTIRISVFDDGKGFPSSVLSRLGSPYNSTRRHVDGHMGLGLFIAITMIEALGGHIRVTNSKAGGAMVVVAMPRLSHYY